ncbi:UNVERIFIED_CONTAM: hypothetical protein GTU68_015743, partial [Idotea baltica]|nr:hypothetical protein [Idotea baltica]
ICLNSPSNPTGSGYTEEELQALGKVIEKSNALVISDEVYERLTYGDYKFISFAAACPQLQDRTVTINAFSKTYSMTGWRVGYLTGPDSVIKGVSKFQSQTTSNVCSIAQHAALAALSGSHDFIDDLLVNFNRRMDLAISYIEKTPGISISSRPQGAFYLFVRIDELIKNFEKISNSVDFATYLLDEAGVAVVPGGAFGDDAAFRISISSSDENIEAGMEKILEAVNKLY